MILNDPRCDADIHYLNAKKGGIQPIPVKDKTYHIT